MGKSGQWILELEEKDQINPYFEWLDAVFTCADEPDEDDDDDRLEDEK